MQSAIHVDLTLTGVLPAAQVNSSEFPEMWNMTKCLAVAWSIAAVGTVAALIFLAAAKPTVWNAWPAFDTTISHPPYVTRPTYSTPGEVGPSFTEFQVVHMHP